MSLKYTVTLSKVSAVTCFLCWSEIATVGGNIWNSNLSAFFFSTFNSWAFLAREREKIWMVRVAFLTRKMMQGEMMMTRLRTAYPKPCCSLAELISLPTMSLIFFLRLERINLNRNVRDSCMTFCPL